MTGPPHRPYPPDRYRGTTGEVELYDGTAWSTAHPGDFMHVPEGEVHGLRGSDHAAMLLVFSPGAPREDCFETLARQGEEPLCAAERVEFMLSRDTCWV